MEVNVIRSLYLLCVDFQYRFASRKVGQLNGHAPVEAAGAGERGIERLGAVRRRENDNADVLLEAVHLGEQLIQGLLAFVVGAELTVALLAYGVDFIDKHYAGSFFFCLAEKIPDL